MQPSAMTESVRNRLWNLLGLCNGQVSGVRPSVCLSVCPVIRPQQRCAASLLLSAIEAEEA